VTITLNGDPFDLSGPLTVSELLASLEIDARRVAVEHNLVVLKRAVFDTAIVREGDQVMAACEETSHDLALAA